jgi:hypothetical protein
MPDTWQLPGCALLPDYRVECVIRLGIKNILGIKSPSSRYQSLDISTAVNPARLVFGGLTSQEVHVGKVAGTPPLLAEGLHLGGGAN